jgi:hypothetical protein
VKTTLLALSVGLGLVLLWAALRPAAAPQEQTAPQHAGEVLQPSAAAPQAQAQAPAAPAAATESSPPPVAERPLSSIRMDYEREPRDAGAVAAEQQIRGIYADDPEASGILREVRCSASVCKVDARWSRHWNKPYNAALLKVIAAFGREISFETGGPPDGVSVPMAIYVRRGVSASAQR